MRIITPRATPVVRAPAPSVPPLAEVQLPPLLRAPVSIITPVSEVELREGSMLAGRLPECDVMIDDGLVSRMHARISVRNDSVVVEDLHSTNGVYVNGAAYHPQRPTSRRRPAAARHHRDIVVRSAP